MNRLVPTLLSIAAVVGFMLPSAQIAHAHDGGHDAHAHGTSHTGHAVLAHAHAQSRPHAHSRSHTHRHVEPVAPAERDAGPDDDREPDGRDTPDPHVHATSAPGAIARAREGDSSIDGSAATQIVLAAANFPCLAPWSMDPDGVVRLPRRDGPRPCSRSIDRLIVLGRLLI